MKVTEDGANIGTNSTLRSARVNAIPDESIISLNVRTFDDAVPKRLLAVIERIVNGEAAASGAVQPPEITPVNRYFLVTNDDEAARRIVVAAQAWLSA